jgi:cytochrome c oxidase subunit 2
MEGIINFHHDLFFFLVVILIFVMYLLFRCLVLFNDNVNKTPLIVVHAPTLEII